MKNYKKLDYMLHVLPVRFKLSKNSTNASNSASGCSPGTQWPEFGITVTPLKSVQLSLYRSIEPGIK
jgi:hypothetical protein